MKIGRVGSLGIPLELINRIVRPKVPGHYNMVEREPKSPPCVVAYLL